MRTLIISDIHIGDPRYDNSHIIELLESEEYDRLILNGDFLDVWLSGLDEIRNDPLFIKISNISKTRETIWIYGNHDYLARNDITIGERPSVNRFLIDEGGKRILVVHGHQVHAFGNRDWASRMFYKINYFIYKHLGIDIQQYFDSKSWWDLSISRTRKRIIDKYRLEADTIVVGHTHRFGHVIESNTELFDCGSPFITRSYALVEDGKVSLHIFSKR